MNRICAPENYACHLAGFADFLTDRGGVALVCLLVAVAASVGVTYGTAWLLGDR